MNNKIRDIRLALGLTEKQISSLLNISSYKYRRFENGSFDIPLSIVVLLAKIYDLTIDELIFDRFDLSYILNSTAIKKLLSYSENDRMISIENNMCRVFSYNNHKMSYKNIDLLLKRFQRKLSKNLHRMRTDNKDEFFEISEKINVTPEYYLKIEQGIIWPTISNIINLSQIFSVSVEDFFK